MILPRASMAFGRNDQAAPRNCPINNAYPRVRGLRTGVDNLRQNLEGVRKFLFISNDEESVTGQRSNQLNYVPTLFSSGLLETSVFAVFPRFPRFPLLPPFPPRITNFGR